MNYIIKEKTQHEDSIDLLVGFEVDMAEFGMGTIDSECKIFITQPIDEDDVGAQVLSRVLYEQKKAQAIERNKIIIEKI